MKTLLTLILIIFNTAIYAQGISFNIYSESELVDFIDKDYYEIDKKLYVNLEAEYISIDDKYFSIEHIEKSSDKKGNYYNFMFNELGKDKIVTIMFPKRKIDKIIIIIADLQGNGYLYYGEIL